MTGAGKSNKQGGIRSLRLKAAGVKSLCIIYVLFYGKENKVVKHFHGKLCIMVNIPTNGNILSPSAGRGFSLQSGSELLEKAK